METMKRIVPTIGVSIPRTSFSSQITCCWKPSSGIPSTIGISRVVWTLVSQNPLRDPCSRHINILVDRQAKAIKAVVNPSKRKKRIILLGSWMSEMMSFLEPGNRNVRVDLGSGEARVTKKFLDRPQVSAIVKEMSGEGMAEFVWGQVLG